MFNVGEQQLRVDRNDSSVVRKVQRYEHQRLRALTLSAGCRFQTRAVGGLKIYKTLLYAAIFFRDRKLL